MTFTPYWKEPDFTDLPYHLRAGAEGIEEFMHGMDRATLIARRLPPQRYKRTGGSSGTGRGRLMTYCLVDDTLTHISQVPSGLVKEATCFDCPSPLVAKKGDVRQHHFSHLGRSKCAGGSPETVLHLRGKQLVAEIVQEEGLRALMPVPDEIRHTHFEEKDSTFDRYGVQYNNTGSREYFNFTFEGYPPEDHILSPYEVDAHIEVKHPLGFTYDVTAAPRGYQHGAYVGIEIVVSHDIDAEKIKKVLLTTDTLLRVDIGDADPDCTDAELKALIKQRAHMVCHMFTPASSQPWCVYSRYLTAPLNVYEDGYGGSTSVTLQLA